MNRKHYGVITFPTSQAAAAAEAQVKAAGYECRLIPMPEQISAGCGLVLQVSVEQTLDIQKQLIDHQISLEGSYEVWFENRKKFVQKMEG